VTAGEIQKAYTNVIINVTVVCQASKHFVKVIMQKYTEAVWWVEISTKLEF